MRIAPFAVEEWMNKYETGAKYNIAETCVDSVSADELFELTGTDKKEFLDKLCGTRLTYGAITGRSELKKGICGLYKTIHPEEIVPTHGGGGKLPCVLLPRPSRRPGHFHHAHLPAALLYPGVHGRGGGHPAPQKRK